MVDICPCGSVDHDIFHVTRIHPRLPVLQVCLGIYLPLKENVMVSKYFVEDITKSLSSWGVDYMKNRQAPLMKGMPWEYGGKRYNHSTNPREFDVNGKPMLATDCFLHDGEVVFIYRIY